MKTQLVLDNFRQFPVTSTDNSDINELLLAMYGEQFGKRYDDDFVSLVPGNAMEIRCVYEVYVDESNFCQLHLLCVNDKPVALCGRHGHEDSADVEITVVDNNTAFVLAQELSAALSRRRLEQYRKELPEAVPQELLSLGGKAFMTALSDSTFGVCDRADQSMLFKPPYSAWYHNGEMLVKLQSTAWRDTEDGYCCFGETADGEVSLAAHRVIFQFLDTQRDLSDTATLMSASGDWIISGKDSSDIVPMAVVYIRQPHGWAHEMHVITFRTKKLYRDFMQQHAAAVDVLSAGEFPFETVPDDASMT